jgi:hypothetical protein
MTYHFPDAFYGQNTKIRETLNNLILKSPQDWQTGVGLPFVRINGTTVEWDEMRFDVRLLQRVPYEGISRMQTSLRRCVPPTRTPALCTAHLHRPKVATCVYLTCSLFSLSAGATATASCAAVSG